MVNFWKKDAVNCEWLKMVIFSWQGWVTRLMLQSICNLFTSICLQGVNWRVHVVGTCTSKSFTKFMDTHKVRNLKHFGGPSVSSFFFITAAHWCLTILFGWGPVVMWSLSPSVHTRDQCCISSVVVTIFLFCLLLPYTMTVSCKGPYLILKHTASVSNQHFIKTGSRHTPWEFGICL